MNRKKGRKKRSMGRKNVGQTDEAKRERVIAKRDEGKKG
jgi:hypothetical protein